MQVGRIVMWFSLALASAASAHPQGTVFLVRHAERLDQAPGDTMVSATDPDLSPAGRARAESLAWTLKDSGITAVFATQYKRTQQTAAPLAKALGLTVQVVDARDEKGLIARVNAASGNVLVVGHSNTVPATLRLLGVDTDITIPDDEYDNLFVVTRSASKPAMIRLRYR